MDRLEKLEERLAELHGKPKSSEEIEEVLTLAKDLEIERAKEYEGMITELKSVGIHVSSIWDLVNTRQRYPKAVDILIKYLPLVKNDKNKEGIIRALAVKEAKGRATPILIDLYENTPKEKDNLRWVIGYAIANVVTPKNIPWLISAVKDQSSGHARSSLIRALGPVKSTDVESTIIDQLKDKTVILSTLETLSKRKTIGAQSAIMEIANLSENSEAKKLATKLLKSMKV